MRSSAAELPATPAIYRGVVRHRRFAPVRHEFRYQVAMAFLDPEALPLAGRRFGPGLRFCRRDHLGEPGVPLAAAVRDLVAARTGERPTGPVRMLTNLRTVGFNFNPITLYWCYGSSRLPEAVVFEVTNTPWGERAAYVARPPRPGPLRQVVLEKSLHVSPFLPMDLEYRFSSGVPDERLDARFELYRDGARVFDADLWCRRRRLDRRGVATLLARPLLGPVGVWAAIYLQAARLRLRGVPVHRHPGRERR